MSDLTGLISKEFGRIRSDKRTLVLLFSVPLILIVTLGLTAGGTTTFFESAVITRDSIETSGNFPDNKTSKWDETWISVMENNVTSFGFHGAENATTEEEFTTLKNTYIEKLRKESIDMFIVLPANFSEVIENGTLNPTITYYIDGSDKTAVDAAGVAMMEPIAMFRIMAGMYENMTQVIPYMEFDVPSWKTQLLNYALSMMLPLIILGLDMNLTSLSIVSEGPLPRMMLTPTGKRDIIASKLVAYSIIMALQVTEVFVATAAFDLYCLGSLLDLYIVLLASGFCGVCMGLFISAISKTEQVANQLYLMMFIVLVMFSGFMPSELLPSYMASLTKILPLSHAMDMIAGITLRGVGINASSMAILLGISVLFLGIAYIAYVLKTQFKRLEV